MSLAVVLATTVQGMLNELLNLDQGDEAMNPTLRHLHLESKSRTGLVAAACLAVAATEMGLNADEWEIAEIDYSLRGVARLTVRERSAVDRLAKLA